MTAQVLRNILVIGASGKLGPSIIHALHSAKTFHITILTRSSNPQSSHAGVAQITTDYSPASLQSAFAGQDAIVCCLGGAATNLQASIIEAATKSSVKRFIPSEFGIDSLNPDVQARLPAAKSKQAIIAKLQEANNANHHFTWTALSVGALFDLCLATGFLGWDLDSQTASICGDGTTKFPATSMAAAGEAVVAILKHPQETSNRFLYFNEFWATTNEVVQALRRLDTSKEWTTTTTSADELLEQGREKLKEGDIASGLSLIMRTLYFDGRTTASQSWVTQTELGPFKEITRKRMDQQVSEVLEAKRGSTARS